jgi:hypothetical protein
MSAERAERIRAWQDEVFANESARTEQTTVEYLGLTLQIPPQVQPITGMSDLLGRAVLDEVDRLDEAELVRRWPHLLDRFIDSILENREIFLFHQRNHGALEALGDNARHQAENEDLEQRFRRFLANPKIALEDRVRMGCSAGAVFGALMGAGEESIFGRAAPEEVAEHVRAVVRDLFPRR